MKINLQNIRSCSLGLLAVVLGTGFSWAQTTFNYTGAVQTYTVPAGVTSISISAAGAQGGSAGGLGAEMTGDFAVTPGEVLTIIVGQEGLIQVGGDVQNSSGGGGGSFVINGSNVLQVAAAGGGGKCNYTNSVALHADAHGKITANGGNDSSGAFLGGTAGNGGGEGQWGGNACAGGGTGWTTQGGGPYGGMGLAGSWIGGTPFCGGGGGGCGGYGGYGGGGGGGNHYGGGGGGGGYSGGAGGGDPDHGGGGGSFSLGTNQVNTPGTNTGNGIVTITSLCTATVLTADVATLATINSECSSTPTAPTATNDCSATIAGTPDVAFPITAQGTTTITWTYDDGVSIITQTQDVVLTDITDPVPDIAALSDITNVTCYLDTIVPPTATDNCAGTVTGTTATVFPITAGGTTTVTWTFDDGNGNMVTQTQDVINPTVDVSVTQAGTMLTANSTGSVYQWVDCDNNYSVIPNEYNQSYTPAVTGNYAVIVMDSVCSDTSACYLVDYTGIEEMVFGEKEVVKIIDLMGRETEFKMNTPLIFIYSDGTRKRVMEIGK